jgi:cytoskeletal protein RodZ
MPPFKKRQLSTDQPIGVQLRAVRRTAKLSLEQVAAATKIRPQFLKALEAGTYETFAAEVYARGFLENYASFLGFPVDEVMLQYKRERGITDQAIPKRLITNQPARESRLTITPRTIGATVGVLSLLIAVGYILSQVFGFASPPKLELTKPIANATTQSDTIDVEGRTDLGASLTINNQPVPTSPDGGFNEKVRLLPGTNVLRIGAKNKTGHEKVVTRQVVLESGAQPSPSAAPVQAAGTYALTVKIGPNSAYVTVNIDGKDEFKGLLLPNTEQTFTAAGRVLITTSNAGSTRVLVNGQDRGTLGSEGQAKKGAEIQPPAATPAPTPRP